MKLIIENFVLLGIVVQVVSALIGKMTLIYK